jgi:hypothetical protein
VEISWNDTACFVERPQRSFKQVDHVFRGHDTIDPGQVVIAAGKELERDRLQVVLLPQACPELIQ